MRGAHKISCEKSKSFSLCVREEEEEKKNVTSKHTKKRNRGFAQERNNGLHDFLVAILFFGRKVCACRERVVHRSCINTFVALSSNTKNDAQCSGDDVPNIQINCFAVREQSLRE